MRWTIWALLAVAAAPTAGAETPVLVELFTSQGCSSCPPAEALLARLVAEQPIAGVEVIALGEHVDYWDRLGWKDPYSSPKFTARQHWYSQAWPVRVYTPQAVIDGRREVVASRADQVKAAIIEAARTPKRPATLKSPAPGRLVFAIEGPLDPGPLDVLLAQVYPPRSARPRSGENAGRELLQAAVVGALDRVGEIGPGDDPTLGIDYRPIAGVERIVVFAQRRGDRSAVAVAWIDAPARVIP